MAVQSYDLTDVNLVAWARRSGGDQPKVFSETVTSDGSAIIVLNNDGNITITAITNDGAIVPSTQYTITSNVIVLNPVPTIGDTITIAYTRTEYTDEEIVSYLVDAARVVGSDLGLRWTVDVDGQTIADTKEEFYIKDRKVWDATIEKLITYRCGMSLFEAKANSAAGDAIKIKDGDTSIDTAATAQTTERALKRLKEQYTENLTYARNTRFLGCAGDGYANLYSTNQ